LHVVVNRSRPLVAPCSQCGATCREVGCAALAKSGQARKAGRNQGRA
jgi:hypothetical protein